VRRTQELKKLGAKTKKSMPEDLDNQADTDPESLPLADNQPD
jgi:hypothetical protein